jgi:hypothetical protein
MVPFLVPLISESVVKLRKIAGEKIRNVRKNIGTIFPLKLADPSFALRFITKKVKIVRNM